MRRSRFSRSDSRSSFPFQVEQLEARQLLAGDVLATVSGSTLVVTGDTATNDIVLSGTGGALQLSSGADTTSITVEGDLSAVKTVSIDLGDGDDRIEVKNLTLDRNVLVDGGSGSKTIVIDNVLLREIAIVNSEAAHSVSVKDSTLSRNLGLVTGAGDSSLEVDNSSVAGKISFERQVTGGAVSEAEITVAQSQLKDLRITDRQSDTSVAVDGATLTGQILIIDTNQMLDVDITNSTVRRGATVRDDGGDLWVGLVDATMNGSLWIRADGAGDHSLALQDSHISGNLSFNSVDGTSSVYMAGDSRVTRRLQFNEDGGSSSLVTRDNTYVGSKLQHTTVGGGNSQTVLRGNAVVDGTAQASNPDGVSDVRIIENAEIDRFVGSGYTTERNVVYAERDGDELRADVYVPKSDGPYPAVVLVHGGAWRFGSKSAKSAEAKLLAERGYVAITINYRLAPEDKFPAQIHDVKSAIMWTRENAAQYNIDPDRIGVYGYSAGGHLALLAAFTDPSAGLEGPDAGTYSSAVQAVVAGGMGTNFRDTDPNSTQYEYLFGGTRAELPDLYAAASPAMWVSPDDPDTFLFVGENDTVIQRDNLDEMRQSMDAAGVTNEFYEVPGKSHVGTIGDLQSKLYAARFLDERLK